MTVLPAGPDYWPHLDGCPGEAVAGLPGSLSAVPASVDPAEILSPQIAVRESNDKWPVGGRE